jgi:hypothetical protein
MSTDEIQIQIIDRYLARIAAALGLADAPDRLDRKQIAKVAGLSTAKSLASSVDRGLKIGDRRWLAFRSACGKGAHRVPTTRIARWMAINDGMLPMPSPTSDQVAPAAPGPGRMWAGLTHRCEG